MSLNISTLKDWLFSMTFQLRVTNCLPKSILLSLVNNTGDTAYFNFFFLTFILFWETERDKAWTEKGQREGDTESEGLQALGCQHRPPHGARTHELRDHDRSQSQWLNRLSHPGAPRILHILNKCSTIFGFFYSSLWYPIPKFWGAHIGTDGHNTSSPSMTGIEAEILKREQICGLESMACGLLPPCFKAELKINPKYLVCLLSYQKTSLKS